MEMFFHTTDCSTPCRDTVIREVARNLRGAVSDLRKADTCEIQYRFTKLFSVAEAAVQRLEATL